MHMLVDPFAVPEFDLRGAHADAVVTPFDFGLRTAGEAVHFIDAWIAHDAASLRDGVEHRAMGLWDQLWLPPVKSSDERSLSAYALFDWLSGEGLIASDTVMRGLAYCLGIWSRVDRVIQVEAMIRRDARADFEGHPLAHGDHHFDDAPLDSIRCYRSLPSYAMRRAALSSQWPHYWKAASAYNREGELQNGILLEERDDWLRTPLGRSLFPDEADAWITSPSGPEGVAAQILQRIQCRLGRPEPPLRWAVYRLLDRLRWHRIVPGKAVLGALAAALSLTEVRDRSGNLRPKRVCLDGIVERGNFMRLVREHVRDPKHAVSRLENDLDFRGPGRSKLYEWRAMPLFKTAVHLTRIRVAAVAS